MKKVGFNDMLCDCAQMSGVYADREILQLEQVGGFPFLLSLHEVALQASKTNKQTNKQKHNFSIPVCVPLLKNFSNEPTHKCQLGKTGCYSQLAVPVSFRGFKII